MGNDIIAGVLPALPGAITWELVKWFVIALVLVLIC